MAGHDHHHHHHFHSHADADAPPLELVDPAQQSLVSALRSSFAILRLIMIVLVVLYLASGVFRIGPGEQGLIVRLGELVNNPDSGRPVFTQGWIWWALPEPFDQKIRIPGTVQRLQIDTFMFQRTRKDIDDQTDLAVLRPLGGQIQPGRDGMMLTGDKSLSHGIWELEFRVDDAAQYVRHVIPAELNPLLRRLFETAILKEVSYRRVEDVVINRTAEIANRVRARVQAELDELQIGITVLNVIPRTIVPAQVAPEFTAVTNAENEMKQAESRARQRKEEILSQTAGASYELLLAAIRAYGAAQVAEASAEALAALRFEIEGLLVRAEGEVARTIRQGEAAGSMEREQIRREFEEFQYWLAQYRQFPVATLLHLWKEMRVAVLSQPGNELFWVSPDMDIIEVIVNRDPERRLEAERRRLSGELGVQR